MVHHISPARLTIERVGEIIDKGMTLELSEESIHRIERCRQYLDDKIKECDHPLYGITTGFGSLCDISIDAADLSTLQENLVKSHACGCGDTVDPQIVKIMLLTKIMSLSFGNSGVQLQTVQRLIDFFNNDILPIIYQLGSLGASGDLAPLANMCLPLLGLGEVLYKGKVRPAAEVLREKGWEPVKLVSKEGLALLNGTQFMSSHAVHAILRIRKLSALADKIGALSLDVFDGRIDPFNDEVNAVRPHPGQLATARAVRRHLDGSELIKLSKKHVQDPYSFRCMPQVHGALPIDYLALAVAELGSISERRIYRLISGARGLPPFLVANPGLNSGFMIPQYAAASTVNQSKGLCWPTSCDSIPSSQGQEDHVSMGGNSATKLCRIVDNTERVLAIELFNAAQALDLRRPLKTSPELEEWHKAYRRIVPFIDNDTVMSPYIAATVDFIRENL